MFESDNASAVHMLDLRTQQVSVVPGSEGLYYAHWSPDGRYIAAYSSDNKKLVVFDFTTRKWAEWAKIVLGYSNWSRDGKYFYFDTIFGSEPAFYRLRVSDHKLERLVSLKELGREPIGGINVWTGLTPDDSPLALRDIGSQEIFALDWETP